MSADALALLLAAVVCGVALAIVIGSCVTLHVVLGLELPPPCERCARGRR